MAVKVSPNITLESSSLLRRIQAYAFGYKNAAAEDTHIESNTNSKELLGTLQSNVQKLDEMCSRLEFMMDEVSSLARRR